MTSPPEPEYEYSVVRRMTIDWTVRVTAPDEEMAERRAAYLALNPINLDAGLAHWSTPQIARLTPRRPRLNTHPKEGGA